MSCETKWLDNFLTIAAQNPKQTSTCLIAQAARVLPPHSLYRCFVVHGADEGQEEEEALLQAAAGRTGEWIPDERVHQQAEAEGAVRQAGPERPTSQNLVSEPQNEEEEADDARARLRGVLTDWLTDWASWTWSWPALRACTRSRICCVCGCCRTSHDRAHARCVCGVLLYLWMCKKKLFIFLVT